MPPPSPALVSRNTHLKIALCSYPKAHHSRFSTRGGAGHCFSSCLCCYWLPSCISHPGNTKLFQAAILSLIFYSILTTWNSVGTQTCWKTPIYLSKPNSDGWHGTRLPQHLISREHPDLAAYFVDPETPCCHHHLQSQLLENRWLEAERGTAGDAEERPAPPSPGCGPRALCFGQVPGLLLALIFLPCEIEGALQETRRVTDHVMMSTALPVISILESLPPCGFPSFLYMNDASGLT